MGLLHSSTDEGRPQGGSLTEGVPLRVAWSEYVQGFAGWKVFATFTFDDRFTDISKDGADKKFRSWWQILNRDLCGHNYTRIVGHGYCAYALSFERQMRGTWHMHALFDDRINFQLGHSVWQMIGGWLWLRPASEHAPKYLCKYVTKGGEVRLYKPEKRHSPAFKPMWYCSPTGGKAEQPLPNVQGFKHAEQQSGPIGEGRADACIGRAKAEPERDDTPDWIQEEFELALHHHEVDASA